MNWEALPETAAIFLGALTLAAVLMHHAALSFMVAFPAALFIFNVAVKVLHGRTVHALVVAILYYASNLNWWHEGGGADA